MNYRQSLSNYYNKYNSILCMGMDPVLSKIPIQENDTKKKIYSFYEEILNEIIKTKKYPACVKPNYAFYARYGFPGLEALHDLIKLYRKNDLPVILDVKRGDIGTTAEAYAEESFDFFEADAVTLSPYLGHDSIEPFTKKYENKGFYILCKTSNKSSGELQDKLIDGKPLYLVVAGYLSGWDNGGIGAVAGATYPDQLKAILDEFSKSGKILPLLIPGVGTQGGDLEAIVKTINAYDISLHRINASSSINFAYEKNGGNFAVAAANEIEKLNSEISKSIGK